jgi:uncharacterized protein (DUF1800 family)
MFVQQRAATGADRAEAAATAANSKPTDPDWAWAPYQPDAQRPWSLPLAGHLYRRAAFGAHWDQLQQALSDGPGRTVDKLLRPEADVAAFDRAHEEYEDSAAGSSSADGLRAWWLRRMIQTPHPLLEKMTLFWHGHFAVSNARVQSGLLMHQYVGRLRKDALGDFRQLLTGIARDPAVLKGLDSDANYRSQPNPNFAGELMDRFSLGAGNFSQEDVQEAARAFTGLFVLRDELRYIDREHDPGEKRILGRRGNFRGEDVVRIVLSEPATPRLVVRRLYGWLISQTQEPDDRLIAPLAESFGKDYDVSRLVERMLRSNLFFSPAAYRQRIKSPVEFALGIVVGLEGLVSTSRLGADLEALGQSLYHPPTVRGWPGGRRWINAATLVGRSNLAAALLSGSGPYGGKLDPLSVATRYGHSTPEAAGRFLLDLFLQGDVEENVAKTILDVVAQPSALAGGEPAGPLRRLAHAVVTLPEYQLC